LSGIEPDVVCEAVEWGKLTLEEVARLLGLPDAEAVRRYCVEVEYRIVCKAVVNGELALEEAAALLGLSESEAGERCVELLHLRDVSELIERRKRYEELRKKLLQHVRDLVEKFDKGEIGPREICEAVTRGELALSDAAILMELSDAEAARKYCKELLSTYSSHLHRNWREV
jgi:hypothetical protein